MRKPFTIDSIPAKYRHMVIDVSDERDIFDQGVWIYMHPEYKWDGEVSIVHEATPREAIAELRNVKIVTPSPSPNI